MLQMHLMNSRVKSGKFGQQVIFDTRLQTVEIQMRRLLMSRLIRISTVCLVNLFFIPIIALCNKQSRCLNLAVCRNILDYPKCYSFCIIVKLSVINICIHCLCTIPIYCHLQTVKTQIRWYSQILYSTCQREYQWQMVLHKLQMYQSFL